MKKFIPLIFISTTIILFVIVFISFLQFNNLLSFFHVLPKAEHLTELYFTNPQDLPNNVKNPPSFISFSIHNLEGQRKKYNYSVFYLYSGKREEIAQSSASLLDNETKTFTLDLQQDNLTNPGKLVVLLNNQQAIDLVLAD